ncbi:fibroblast growth factor-binding protein 1-like [Microcaecilia unicolor]|uniref:Fibroblast growth factor-binding protein 1-like n=1 Tax=Microcaecilia unicolor TaxID=1415580 RepID=A0A6P7YNE4_9AMPH|nr:fibroblast growth factor-binding protein 1-like [Microcaecilia unicolor]
MKIRSITFLCLVVLLSQLLLVNCRPQKERRHGKTNKEKNPDTGKQKVTSKDESKPAATDQIGKRQKLKLGKGVIKGSFSKKDKTECTWAVTGKDTVNLKVECTRGVASFWCIFEGHPSSIHFKADEKSYWKQIGRALRKKKNLCEKQKGVLKSKMCKKGPQDAHLTMISSSLVEIRNINKDDAAAYHERANAYFADTIEKDVVKEDVQCMEDGGGTDQKKLAEEYCGKGWSSVLCILFFSAVHKKC